jgi:hypothetical protein
MMPTAMTSENEAENSHRGGELLLEFLNLGLQVRAGMHTGEMKHGPAGEVRESRCTPGPGRRTGRPGRDSGLPHYPGPGRRRPIRLESRGSHELKGLLGSWEVFAVVS